jgi:hypothetical protein
MVYTFGDLSFCAGAAHANSFPCDSSAIVGVSVGIGGGVCALLFVYYLLMQVRRVANV